VSDIAVNTEKKRKEKTV